MKKTIIVIIVLVLIGLIWHYTKKAPVAVAPEVNIGDTYLGTWTGVEGTSLTVQSNGDDTYTLNFVTLDGPVKATGTARDTGLIFTREGKELSLVKGTGAETGMKWLAEKTNCVVVKADQPEGYCRDVNANDPIADVAYSCDDKKTIRAKYYTDSVWLGLSDGRQLTLPQAMAASGARYVNDDSGYVFWNKGETAFLAQEGVEKSEYANCVEIDPTQK